MASEYSKEEMAELRDVFANIDTDNSGSITLEELQVAMRRLGRDLSEADLQKILKQADLDGNGVIEFEEFLAVLAHNPTNPDQELLEMFQGFDENGDGFVSPEELKRVMQRIGERRTDEEISAMIKEVDLNNDGMVNYEEFVKMMRSA